MEDECEEPPTVLKPDAITGERYFGIMGIAYKHGCPDTYDHFKIQFMAAQQLRKNKMTAKAVAAKWQCRKRVTNEP